MLELVLGGLLRMVPEVSKLWTAKADRDHEYRMLELQMEVDKFRAEHTMDLARVQSQQADMVAEWAAMQAAAEAQARPSGVRWIDGLSSSVRPVLTYWWCVGLYTWYKAVMILASWPDIQASLVLSTFDESVVLSIIGFWFTDRVLRRGTGGA